MAAAALIASTLAVLPVSAASADEHDEPVLPETISADVLPTPQINGVVWNVAVAGTTAYAVGSFSSARPSGAAPGTNAVGRNNAMAFNVTTGAILPWNPNLNAQARAAELSPDGSTLYIGGDFTTVGGQTRSKIAAFSASSGALISSFSTSASGAVRGLAITNSTVYAGGSFASTGNLERSNLAAFNRSNGDTTEWAPTADGIVETLVAAADNSRVIVGGRFQNVNGSPQVGVGAVDGSAGASQTWTSRPIPTARGNDISWVTDMVVRDGVVYATGNGEGGNWFDGRFAATFANGDLVWLDNCYGASYGAAVLGEVMYHVSHSHDCSSVGAFPEENPRAWYRALANTLNATGTDQSPPGAFSNYSGQPVPTQLGWYPKVNAGSYTGIFQGGWSLGTNGDYLVMGGEFTRVNEAPQQGLATFAKRSIAPNKVRPVYNADTKPSVLSLSNGTARVAFKGTSDYDDPTLTYEVLRDNSLTPIHTIDELSQFWALPQMGFIDTGLTPGSTHTYRINIKDPWGNSYISPRSDVVTISSTDPSAYAQGIVGDGATSYWPLNETDGTVVYDNAGFNDADTGSGLTRGVDGAIPGDPATSFSGTNQGLFATRTPIEGPDTFTLETWINTTSIAGGKIIGFGANRSGNSSGYDRHVYMDGLGRITFGVHPGGVRTVQSSTGYNDGQWHLVTASLGADGMKLYIDGLRVAQRSDVTTGQEYSGYWRVGGDNLNGWPNRGISDYFAGSIDDVAIYPTALARGTVLDHYTASGRTSTVPPAPTDEYGQAVYQDEPDLFWRLDDLAGTTAQDASLSSNSGLISGTVTHDQPGALVDGRSFGFNGSDGLVAASNPATNPTVYSLETWFKTTTTQGGKLIGFGNTQTGLSDNYDRHVYMQDDGKLAFGTYTGQLNIATSGDSYNDGEWHHMVATQSQDGLQLYVDSALVATNPQTSAQNYTGYWRIGGDNTWSSSSPFFNGQLDEVAVYSAALTPLQIITHYEAAVGPIPNREPVAGFTESITDLSVAFDGASSSDEDGEVVDHAWNFGDGETATGVTTSHTYATEGPYTVMLTVTDNEGGTHTVSKDIVVLDPPAAPTDAYGAAVDAANPSIFWRLDEPGGTVAQDSSLSGNAGLASGGMTHGVEGVLPDFDGTAISFNGQNGVIASETAFTDPRNFSMETWFKTTTDQGGKLMGFGDQKTGTSGNYDRHIYMQRDGTLAFGVWTGQPNLATSTQSYNDGGWHHLVATQSTTDGLVLYVDGEVVGTNPQTDVQIYTGYWRIGGDTNWGDGGAFFDGDFDETAIYGSVLNGAQVREHYELVVPPAANVNPTAAFTSTLNGLTASFDASASTDADGTITAYDWDFGDGETGTGATPQHVYAAGGDFTVELTVTDDRGGVHTASEVVTAVAPNVAPVASFATTIDGLDVEFDASASNDSDGTIADYAWDFGDGTTATGAAATHRFAADGTYPVALTVTDDDGETTTATMNVTVTNLPPVADFTSSANGLAVEFDGSTSSDADGSVAEYAWDFGDGTTAATVNPAHTFAASGTFEVTLTVTDDQGATDELMREVTVNTINSLPTASFTSTADGLAVTFDATASVDDDGTIEEFDWDFGDGTTGTGATVEHTYADGDTYTVTLTVTDNRGGVNSMTDEFTVMPNNALPTAAFTSTVDELNAAFDASTSTDTDGTISGYAWDFGDDTTATGVTANHEYAVAGEYTVTLTVTDDDGGVDVATAVVAASITPNDAPVASFTQSISGVDGTFDASGSTDSDGTIETYSWNFGDGATATGVTAEHTYGAPGSYTVTLTVTDDDGATSSIGQDVAATNSAPVAAFSSAVTGLDATFDSTGSSDADGTIASHVWDFGDGATSAISNPSHGYTTAGTYAVTLTVTDNLGGTGSITHPVTVAPANVGPTADFTATSVGLDASFDASASSDADGSVAEYDWTFGDGATGTGETTEHEYTTADTFQVTLTVTDDDGATSSITKDVTVSAVNVAPEASFTSTATLLSASFDASGSSDSDGSITGYSWSFGDDTDGVGVTPSHDYAEAGTYTVTLTVTDDDGSTDTATESVTVSAANSAPVSFFTASVTGLSVQVDGSGSTDSDGTIATYAWDFGGERTATGRTAMHTFANSGTYAVSLTVTDDDGATHTFTQDVTVTAPPTTTVFARDAFERTVSGGFGSADVGGTWSSASANSNFSVANGIGRIRMGSAGSGPSMYLNSVSSTNTEVKVSVGLDKAATGGGVDATVIGRGIVSQGDYRAQLKFLPNGSVTIGLYRAAANGAQTALAAPSVLPGLTYTVGESLNVRLQVSGTSPTILNVKVWKSGTTEPAQWQKTATDSTGSLQTAGRVGLFSYLSGSATNAPVTGLWDNFSAAPASDAEPTPNVAPVAAFTSTVNGLSVSFDASASSDSDGTVNAYSWSFGDTTSGAGRTPTHSYPAPGSYPVTLTVTDDDGATHSVNSTVTVVEPAEPENAAPVSSFVATIDGLASQFSGSGSSDSDGTIASYAWDLGDGTTATGATTSHTYDTEGTYTVTLTVTDNDAATHTSTQSLSVTATPASAVIAQDAFERGVIGGFGTADVGGAWTSTSSNSNFSVADGNGYIRMANAGSGPSMYLSSVSSTDTDVRVRIGNDKVATGGGISTTVVGRSLDGTGDYRVQVKYHSDGSVGMALYRAAANGALTALTTPATVAGLSYAVGETLEVRLQVTGTSPTTLRAKVWKSGEAEPTFWQKAATDNTAALQSAGRVGLNAYLSGSATNAPVVASFDNLLVGETE